MYLSFYHLHQNPFQISTDSRFLWLGPKHEEALATLRYGVRDNKGFLLLTGDVGTGKTTLVNALLRLLGDDVLVAVIRDPHLDTLDFYNYIGHAFHMEREFNTKVSFLIHFEKFLHQAHEAGNKVLLVIDEAQRITQGLLEEVRLLSNIEREESKLLNIFFVGQIEFNEILLRPENRPIRQRITVNYDIPPLTVAETGAYIRHRLAVAGTGEGRAVKKSPQKPAGAAPAGKGSADADGGLFEEEAIRRIYAFSGGYPRLINIICDRCLLTGFVEEAPRITAAIVDECREELTIVPPVRLPTPAQAPVSAPAPPARPEVLAPLPAEKEPMSLAKKMLLGAMLLLLLGVILIPLQPAGPSGDGRSGGANFARFWQELLHGKSVLQEVGAGPEREVTPPVSKPAEPAMRKEEAIVTAPVAGSSPAPPQPPAGPSPPAPPSALVVVPVPAAPVSPPAAPVEDASAPRTATVPVPLEPGDRLVIPFGADSTSVPSPSLAELNSLAEVLLQRPEWKVVVRGYTDALGTEAYNNRLSEFRAATVRSYLVGRGVEEARITALGMGSQDPAAPHDAPGARTANRRVEIEIVR